MKTKDKILDASRKLFNANGLDAVSVRDICKQLDISAGNFSYHYPNKDKIILELYELMLREMQLELQSVYREQPDIISYLESHKMIFEIQMKYKFIYLNLFEIVNKFTTVKTIFLKNYQIERDLAKGQMQACIASGVIRKTTTNSTIDHLVDVGHIIHNTWLMEAELSPKTSEKKRLKHYLAVCCGLLEPYLTTESLKQYKSFFKRLE